jgi:rsbT antagonist protein RsbS
MYEDSETHRIPILQFWNVLLVPLQGDINDTVAAMLADDVLDEIHRSGARALVLDLTGVWMLDSHLCSVLARIAASAQLMGTNTIISGMSPEVAHTLQTMGAELHNVDTALTLENALELAGIHRAQPEDGDPFLAVLRPLDQDADDWPGQHGPPTQE